MRRRNEKRRRSRQGAKRRKRRTPRNRRRNRKNSMTKKRNWMLSYSQHMSRNKMIVLPECKLSRNVYMRKNNN